MNPNDNVNFASSAVMVIHCCIWFEQKVSCDGILGGLNILKHLYLNNYPEFDSKMFLHDNLLACEISTVNTLALKG